MKMNEATCNTEVVRSLKHFGWLAYKISDQVGGRFTVIKPCDILACSPKGCYVAIESKLMKKWGKFDASALRPNQIEHLTGVTLKRDGRAFVFLFVRISRNPKKGVKSVHKLVVFDWKKHSKKLLNGGYTIEELRNQQVGQWFDPVKDKHGKIIWPLKNLLTSEKG